SLYLDRGERALAARCFTHLLGWPEATRLPPLALYKAAVACRLAGDEVHEEQAWKALAARAADGVTIGGPPLEAGPPPAPPGGPPPPPSRRAAATGPSTAAAPPAPAAATATCRC